MYRIRAENGQCTGVRIAFQKLYKRVRHPIQDGYIHHVYRDAYLRFQAMGSVAARKDILLGLLQPRK